MSHLKTGTEVAQASTALTTGQCRRSAPLAADAEERASKIAIGRPKKTIDPDQVRRIAKLGGTQIEAAEAVGVSLATLKTSLGSDPSVKEAWEEGRQIAKARSTETNTPPRPNEGRLMLNLGREKIGQLRKIAGERQITTHSVAVAAIDTYLTNLRP